MVDHSCLCMQEPISTQGIVLCGIRKLHMEVLISKLEYLMGWLHIYLEVNEVLATFQNVAVGALGLCKSVASQASDIWDKHLGRGGDKRRLMRHCCLRPYYLLRPCYLHIVCYQHVHVAANWSCGVKTDV